MEFIVHINVTNIPEQKQLKGLEFINKFKGSLFAYQQGTNWYKLIDEIQPLYQPNTIKLDLPYAIVFSENNNNCFESSNHYYCPKSFKYEDVKDHIYYDFIETKSGKYNIVPKIKHTILI